MSSISSSAIGGTYSSACMVNSWTFGSIDMSHDSGGSQPEDRSALTIAGSNRRNCGPGAAALPGLCGGLGLGPVTVGRGWRWACPGALIGSGGRQEMLSLIVLGGYSAHWPFGPTDRIGAGRPVVVGGSPCGMSGWFTIGGRWLVVGADGRRSLPCSSLSGLFCTVTEAWRRAAQSSYCASWSALSGGWACSSRGLGCQTTNGGGWITSSPRRMPAIDLGVPYRHSMKSCRRAPWTGVVGPG